MVGQDGLREPWQRREAWAAIAAMLATQHKAQERATEAIGYACMEDPPRDWPEGAEAVYRGLPEMVAHTLGWDDPMGLRPLGGLGHHTWPG